MIGAGRALATMRRGVLAAVALLGLASAHARASTSTAPPLMRVWEDTGRLEPMARAPRVVGHVLPAAVDTFLVGSWSFDTPDGSCHPHGWTGEDLAGVVYAHVSNRFVVNGGGIAMGTKALWFGADSASAPAEVAHWPYSYGYGNRWSQRATSPTFSLVAHPATSLSFDATVDFKSTGGLVATALGYEFLAVQGLKPDGTWAFLNARFVPTTGSTFTAQAVRNRGTFRCVVPLDSLGNAALGLATTGAQLRIVVQTDNDSSQADGSVVPTPGAAVVDNLKLEEGGVPVVPGADVDFEGGTTGVWTLSAMNSAFFNTNVPIATRDAPLPATQVALRGQYDFADPTCLWTFLSAGDTLARGTNARIVSPWMALARPETGFEVAMGGKLPLTDSRRFVYVQVFGKQAGDARPRLVGRTRFAVFIGGNAPDVNSPYFDGTLLVYPGDFRVAPALDAVDSIQVTFEVHDRGEQFNQFEGRPKTALPFLDTLRVIQLPVDVDEDGTYEVTIDRDHDGVPDLRDACPDVSAAGEDANGDGCRDATASLRHVETWPLASRPIHYVISQNADPTLGDGSDLAAIRAAFTTWSSIPGAAVPLIEDSLTARKDASALDGLNLVTFEDDYQFPANVIAVTPSTSSTRRIAHFDRMTNPGEIVDTDILLNPTVIFDTPTRSLTGGYDLQSVMTHEIGHLIGLSHSGVPDATMYPVLLGGAASASLTDDDRAAAAGAYPSATLATDYGTIRGRVVRGGTSAPVGGALVIAQPIQAGVPTGGAASDFTREDGTYALRRLPPGSYAVRIEPLDGSTPELVPDAINDHVDAIAATDFGAEWWSTPESGSDDPAAFTAVIVAAAQIVDSINVVTTVDVTPPTVVSVTPVAGRDSVRIDTAVLVTFSETIVDSTLSSAFKLRPLGNTGTLGGRGRLLTGGRRFVFTADDPLAFNTTYEIVLGSAIKDRAGNPLVPVASTFKTEKVLHVAITSVQPRQAPAGALVTLTGTGFDASPSGVNRVAFAGAASPAPALQVTPASLVVRVPDDAGTGNVRAVVNGDSSNALLFTRLVSAARAAPVPSGSLALDLAPTDVAVAPDGLAVFAAGEDGVQSFKLAPASHTSPIARGAHRMALTPDGLRLYVTRPDSGDVVQVVADRARSDFGQVRATIAIEGRPDGVVIDAAGARAYVSDQAGETVFVIDLDATSLGFHQVVRELRLPEAVLSGGLALDPFGGRLLATSSNLGLLARPVDDTTVVAVVAPAACADNVALTPDGAEAIAAPDGEVGSPPLGFARLASGATAGLGVGGSPRDVLVDPLGRSLYVVNALLGRVQVVDVTDTTLGPGLAVIADVAAGTTPVAIAQSGDGALLAVANLGSRSVSLFGAATAANLALVTPPVASPGDRVALYEANGAITSATAADLGDGATAAADAVAPDPHTLAFVTPSGTQQDGRVSLAVGASVRSLALPFRVLDPIASFGPRDMATNVGTLKYACAPDSVYRPVRLLRSSPQGGLLAIVSGNNTSACGAAFDLIRADDLTGAFGERLLSTTLAVNQVFDAAFTADGKELWIALRTTSLTPQLRRVNVDPTSAQFGATISNVNIGGLGGDVDALANDPGGRWMYARVGSQFRVARYLATGAFKDTLDFPNGTALGPMVATPDGRYLVVGGGPRTFFVRALDGDLLLAATTPAHTGSTQSITVTRNGRYVVAVNNTGEIGVWNALASAGTIGAELYFGSPLPVGVSLTELIPGPDTTSVVAGCSTRDSLVRLRPGAGAPALTFAGIGRRSHHVERTMDGRTVWVGRNHGASALQDEVEAFTLSEAARLALVSGAAQEGAASGTLPVPIRVQAVDALGHPQAGAVLAFAVADTAQGTLDPPLAATRRLRVTDTRGEAAVTWKLPGHVGAASLSVGLLGTPGATVATSATAVLDEALAAPAVVEIGPTPGATGIRADSPVFVRFSQSMDRASVEAGISFTANGSSPPGTEPVRLEFGDDDRLVLLRWPTLLPFAAACTLSVDPGIVDRDGQATVAPALTSFTVEPQPALALFSIAPPAAAVGASVILSGDGFSSVPSQNLVLFGSQIAPVLSASTRALTVHVPLGAVTGPVTVRRGTGVSNPETFTVLPANPVPARLEDSVTVTKGVRHIAITPDGARAYLSNPSTNSITALDIHDLAVLAILPVGLKPEGLAILPDPQRVYVANTETDNVSVVDADPHSVTYHQVLRTITVGDRPTDVAISPIGPLVLVVNSRDSTLSLVDGQPKNATFDHVVKSVPLGSAGTSVTVAPDGSFAYVIAHDQLLIVDLPGRRVVKSVPLGSAGTTVTVAPDGTLLFVLTRNGLVLVIDLVASSPNYRKVVKSVPLGSAGTHVTVSPDGTLAYVTIQDGNVVLVFRIVKISDGGVDASTGVPGTAVELEPVASIPVTRGPAGMGADPQGAFLLVGNEGSGTVTLLATGAPVPVTLDLWTDRTRFSEVSWVNAYLEPVPPAAAADIDVTSVRLDGVLPIDPTAPVAIVDHDGDGVAERLVRFPRTATMAALPHGAQVPVTVSGRIGEASFVARDTVRVETSAVHHPLPAGEKVPASAPHYPVVYDSVTAALHATMLGTDPILRWRVLLGTPPNTGRLDWAVPSQLADTMRIAVIQVEQEYPDSSVRGVVAISGLFSIAAVGSIDGAPARLELAAVRPTPSRGAALVRFGLPRRAPVTLEVLDVQGRRVGGFERVPLEPGWHEWSWTGSDAGHRAAAGLYFVRLRVEGEERTSRIVWLR